jgi:hypothetical protein
MIPQSCLLIETTKFPIMPGEDQEIVNPRMYGKALCLYLESVLPDAGVTVPFFCAEDWGWWLEVAHGAFTMGLCIYSDPAAEKDPGRYAILPSIHDARQWSWSKFRRVDKSANVLGLMAIVERVLRQDSDIAAVTRHDDYPWGG